MHKFTATVHQKIKETPRVVRVLLSAPELKSLAFRPGQWIGIASEQLLGENNRPLRRAFSIASHVNDEFLELCVARGKSLSAFLQDAPTGTKLNVDGPYGTFWLKPAEKYLFVAGGTGIAPFRPMIKEALANKKEVVLIYSFKTPDDFIYKEELESLKGKFTLVTTLTQFDKPWNGEKGRTQTILHKHWKPGALAYICGPVAMVEEVQKKLIELGQPEKEILVEKWE
ncbi:MAG TPA: FAD-dependent oxidoreductase [Candidatus Nanoarchaeia archaeon]|nr:FAD-dependent oxidoreductase [Candidatus Nanoarchaeia archaeon]